MTAIVTREAHHVPRRRWGIAFLLGFGVLVNYFDRVNLSVSRRRFTRIRHLYGDVWLFAERL